MRRLAPILVVLAIAGLLWWGMSGREPQKSAFLGYVEGALLYIAPVEGERVASLAVEAGAVVKKDAPLFSMDTTLLRRQREAATARIGEMEARVENLRTAQNRPEQIAVLNAAVERAQAAVDLSQSDLGRQRKLYADGHVAKAALDRSVATAARDEATLKEAKRQVDFARLGSRSHEIDAAEEGLKQAMSQRDQLDLRLSRQTVLAPADGMIQDVFFRAGEMVNAGQPVLALLPPGNRKVRFYAPQGQLAALKLGDKVQVHCDNCPAGVEGRITYMSGREEFTPPVIFSDVERQKLVFKVEAQLEGAGRELPLGLPVSVRPAPQEAPKQ